MPGAGLNAPVCLFPIWNLSEFLDFANLGLNVNLKDLGCEMRNLETKSVLGPCAKFAKCEMFISRGEYLKSVFLSIMWI